jgi:hypothetical protein
MGSWFARVSAIILVSLIGASVLNVAFTSDILFPSLLFSIVVSLSLSKGFVKAMPAVIIIGLVADIATFDRIGLLAAFSVGLAYSAGFFSRRFVVGHGFMTHLFAGFLIGFGTILFSIVAFSFGIPGALSRTVAGFSFGIVPMALILGVVSFSIVEAVLRRFENWLSYLDAPNVF